MTQNTKDLLEQLFQAAEAHGADDEPDHEVGDLQEILRSCWAKLSETQKLEVFEEHADLIVDWGTP